MSDLTYDGTAYIQEERNPALPPPAFTRGPWAWARGNLFSSPGSTALTVLFAAVAVWGLSNLFAFAFGAAVWRGDGALCRANPDGACWPFIADKFSYLRYGSYPVDQRWRVNVVEVIGAVLIAWLLWTGAPKRNVAAVLFFIAYPIVAFVLLRGSTWVGLPVIDTSLWGGILITLLVSVVGIVFSLPLGVLLALGRRSDMPIVRAASVTFIEFVRGVPFIIVLFMANVMLPLFVPDWLSPDRLLRPLIGTVLFSAAYMAEIVRGGLQAMPKGQTEGAQALGLGYWQTMRLVILPQALTIVIPGIVSTFIGLFKDTSLVPIVGIADFLRTVETARLDPNWAGPTISPTGYLFAAAFYWVFCFGMSRYSLMTERRLNRGRKH